MRAVDDVIQQFPRLAIHAQMLEVQAPGLLVEDPHHHPFALAGRQGGDPHVHRATGDPQRDAPVLRHPLLGDVEPRHDLDARDDERRQGAVGLQHLAQHAVHAEAHHQPRLEGFDMNVGGVLADGLGEQGVDQADDGGIVLVLDQILRLGQGFGHAVEIQILADAFHRFDGAAGAILVGLLQQFVEFVLVHLAHFQRRAKMALGFEQGLGAAVGAAHGLQAIGGLVQHQDAVALGEGEGQAGFWLTQGVHGRHGIQLSPREGASMSGW